MHVVKHIATVYVHKNLAMYNIRSENLINSFLDIHKKVLALQKLIKLLIISWSLYLLFVVSHTLWETD